MQSSLHKPADAADHRGYYQYLLLLEDPAHTTHGGQTEVWPVRLWSIR